MSALMNFANSSARNLTGMPHKVNCTLSRPSSLGRERFRIYTHIGGGPNEDSGGMAMRRPMSADDSVLVPPLSANLTIH